MSRARAFTLLEVLLAIAIAGALFSGIMAFLSQVRDGRDRLRELGGQINAGNAVIERIEQDLLAVVASAHGAASGVKGDSTSLKFATRGVWLGIASEAGPEEESLSGVKATVASGDLQMSEYVYDSSAGTLSARRWDAAGSAEAGDGSPLEVVADHVRRLRFRYHDGREWLEQFDSGSGGGSSAAASGQSAEAEGLPVAVEVAIWFGAPVADGEKVDRWPAPDRLRVVAVPDGPAAAGAR